MSLEFAPICEEPAGQAIEGPAIETPVIVERRLPLPLQLERLGTVLCLYRADQSSELSGWQRAVSMSVRLDMDSDGLRESLWFHDGQRRCCWRLYLLPDSDFLGWDCLAAQFPVVQTSGNAESITERMWRKLAVRLSGAAPWRACVIRLHPAGANGLALAASLAAPSTLGATTILQIARAEGVDGPPCMPSPIETDPPRGRLATIPSTR